MSIKRENYLLELTRHIVLNPVRAGVVQWVRKWPWSSFRAMIGLVEKPDWLQDDGLLPAFSKIRSYAIQIVRACQRGGYTLKEIADYFNLHYSTAGVISEK